MKRITALVLLLGICLALCACNQQEPVMKNDIVGEWMAPSINAAAVFREDGTGEIDWGDKESVTWKYDPEQDCYVITGTNTTNAKVGKEYDMPYLSIEGVDFYHFDDYDKAYNLMISKRLEDILIFTENMTKIELNKSYDLANAVSIEFTDVTRDSSEKGLLVSYTVTNHRNETVTEGLISQGNGKGYFVSSSSAVDLNGSFQWADSIDAGNSVSNTLTLMFHENVPATIQRDGRVIGAVCFEFSGQSYYFDIGDWLK